MNETDGVTGIVLAGGMSRRLGRDKAVETIAGQALILSACSTVSLMSLRSLSWSSTTVSAKRSFPYPDSVIVAVDIYPDTGSLGGIFTGLSASSNQWGIVVACDMPFLNLELMEQSPCLSVRATMSSYPSSIIARSPHTRRTPRCACLPSRHALGLMI